MVVSVVAAGGCASVPASVAAHRRYLHSVALADGTLSYIDAGPKDGPVIVLAHGLPTSSYLYRKIIPAVAAYGYRVVAPDLFGFGASTKPSHEAAYDLKAQGRRLLALLEHLEIPRFSLVIHDLGGLVSFELLDLAVERILVLNTTAYPDAFSPPPQMRQLGGALGGLMSSMMRGRLLGKVLTRKFVRDNMAHPDRLDAEAVENYWWPLHEGATVPMRAIAKRFDAIVGQFGRYQAALRRFAGPASLLWGKRDRVLPFEKNSRQFARDLRIPPERVRGVDDAGHFIPEDHPQVVTEAIVELMSLPAVEAHAAGPAGVLAEPSGAQRGARH